MTVATTAWLLSSADEHDATSVLQLLVASAGARLALERKQGAGLVAAASDRAAAQATETAVVAAWKKWYDEAFDSVRRLPVKGPSPGLDARVARAQEELKAQ